MKQNRLRSKLLWAAVIAQAISICQFTGAFRQLGLDAGVVGDVTAAVLQILALVGILNDPTNPEGF